MSKFPASLNIRIPYRYIRCSLRDIEGVLLSKFPSSLSIGILQNADSQIASNGEIRKYWGKAGVCSISPPLKECGKVWDEEVVILQVTTSRVCRSTVNRYLDGSKWLVAASHASAETLNATPRAYPCLQRKHMGVYEIGPSRCVKLNGARCITCWHIIVRWGCGIVARFVRRVGCRGPSLVVESLPPFFEGTARLKRMDRLERCGIASVLLGCSHDLHVCAGTNQHQPQRSAGQTRSADHVRLRAGFRVNPLLIGCHSEPAAGDCE